MKNTWIVAAALPAVFFSCAALADHANVGMSKIDVHGIRASIGTIEFMDTPQGLAILTYLKDLPPGQHGFHVHTHPSCDAKEKDGQPVAGLAAGDHYDPAQTGRHAGPQGQGHLGDLPLLTVTADGRSRQNLTAPNLKVADLKNRSIMIHAGGDNFSDEPKPLGGGGERIACGVVE